jgi:hypothetical protein
VNDQQNESAVGCLSLYKYQSGREDNEPTGFLSTKYKPQSSSCLTENSLPCTPAIVGQTAGIVFSHPLNLQASENQTNSQEGRHRS